MISEWFHDAPGLGASIPPRLTMGVTSSAFQVEGAVREDGREPSTWDTFMGVPGRIRDGSTAAITADHYHRVSEDVRLLSELGIDSYGFSLAWTRLQPIGKGSANRTAVAFYDRLLDELLAAGIRPMVTLHHFDLPEPLQHVGGWLARDTAFRLADFAFLAGEAFGDRVDSWVTIADPATVTLNGYALGSHAPGARLLLDALPVAHHQLLGHGLAVQALRAADVAGGVGITLSHSPVEPASDRVEDDQAAALFDLVVNRIYADPVLLGRYPEAPDELREYLTAFDEIEPADLLTIAEPLDFLGVGYSGPSRVRAAPRVRLEGDALAGLPFARAPWPEYDRTGSGRPNAPEFLRVALHDLAARYGTSLPPVVVTEVGATYPDVVPEGGGTVEDEDRASYLADHLAAAAADAPGVELRGFFVRSLLDGWEWDDGFTQPHGLVHVDRQTRARTPKRSYRFLQTVLSERN